MGCAGEQARGMTGRLVAALAGFLLALGALGERLRAKVEADRLAEEADRRRRAVLDNPDHDSLRDDGHRRD